MRKQSITNKLPRVTRKNVIERLVGGIHQQKEKELKSIGLQQRSNQSRNDSNDQTASNRVGYCTINVTGTVVGWAGRIAGGGAVESLGKALECGKGLAATLITIDGKHHPGTAVAGLTTVSPDGRGIVDGERPGGEVGGIGSNWEEARVEPDPLASGLVGQGHARSSERRLGDGVVLHLEDELDGITRSSTNTVRSVGEISVGTTDNNLDDVAGRGDRGGTRRPGVRRVGRCPNVATERDGICHKGWRGRRGDGSGSVISGPSGRWILSISLELSADRESSVLEVGEGVGGTVSTTVDGMDHTTASKQHGQIFADNKNIRILTLRNGCSECCYLVYSIPRLVVSKLGNDNNRSENVIETVAG